MAIDERLVGALHVEALGHGDMPAERHPHDLFQTSTIAALLEGAYDGDVTFADLAERGDLGLGTLDACDGEMIAVDGSFMRAAVDGTVNVVAPEATTPFAVVTFFRPVLRLGLEDALEQDGLLELVDEHVGKGRACHALRVDGRFDRVTTRSVPRQSKPYPPLTEVVKRQRVVDHRDVDGTIVGFRFPDYAQGLNVAGYHLHFVTSDRSRGGHVLDLLLRRGTLAIDRSTELHVELPPGVELGTSGVTANTGAALREVEHPRDPKR